MLCAGIASWNAPPRVTTFMEDAGRQQSHRITGQQGIHGGI